MSKIGETYTTIKGQKFKIIDYTNSFNVTIMFEDSTIVKNLAYSDIKKGNVKNYNYPIVYGVGYFGYGVHKGSCKKYALWNSMLSRCYSNKKHSYKDSLVDERWHNYQIFGDWFEENYIEGFHLDKDILIKGNKVYSPEACCFVPREINNALIKRKIERGELPIGVRKQDFNYVVRLQINKKSTYKGSYSSIEEAFSVYKEAKEQELQRIANIWKLILPIKTYSALVNYKIEITD